MRHAPLAIVAILALVASGCAFNLTERPHQAEPTPRQAGGGKMAKTYDDLLAEVAIRHPGFGGMFINAEQGLSVYLLDPTQSAAAEAAIAAVFGPQRIPREGIQALQGQYGFLQLKEWYNRMVAVWEISGVALIDIDEGRNRLAVGLEQIAQRGAVEDKLKRMGIPRDAVIIEETDPLIPLVPGP